MNGQVRQQGQVSNIVVPEERAVHVHGVVGLAVLVRPAPLVLLVARIVVVFAFLRLLLLLGINQVLLLPIILFEVSIFIINEDQAQILHDSACFLFQAKMKLYTKGP